MSFFKIDWLSFKHGKPSAWICQKSFYYIYWTSISSYQNQAKVSWWCWSGIVISLNLPQTSRVYSPAFIWI
jgi:hypothetical protein